MGGCSAFNCTNSSTKGHQMFRFPTNPERRKKWAINCRRDNWIPGKNPLLCSAHFEENQYEQNRMDKWKKLKQTAIPTLFDVPNPPLITGPLRFEGSMLTCINVKPGSILQPEINIVQTNTGDNNLKRRKLKRNAIPSCNLPTSPEYADDEANVKVGMTKKSISNKKAPVIEEVTSGTKTLHCVDEDSYESSGDETSSNSINEVHEENIDASLFNITQLHATKPSFLSVAANAIEQASKNLENSTENGTVPDLPVKLTENSKFDYSIFKSSPLDCKEVLTQKLDIMISVNEMLQKRVEFFQSKCKMYEKEVNIMKGVIDNLKLINSVTFDN